MSWNNASKVDAISENMEEVPSYRLLITNIGMLVCVGVLIVSEFYK